MAKQATKASVNAGGVVGENTIWDGPLSQLGRPHGKGSSSESTNYLCHAGTW